ncbi:MAG: hypothetical protein LBQ51_00685 [Desulfovibrio sp.]|nr:hypothetical protein [Desulfovibrio sp.]
MRRYTFPELAALIGGVTAQDVRNTYYFRDSRSVAGTKAHTVREAMRERGITWDQIGPSQKGRSKPKSPATSAQAAPAILGESESSTTQATSEARANQDTQPEQTATSTPKPYWPEPLPENWPDVQTLYRTASLEDLLREIRRRLPDADIRITLPMQMPEARS